MKPNASFKFPKSAKLVLGTILDREQRRLYKQSMIQAILAETLIPKRTPRESKEIEKD